MYRLKVPSSVYKVINTLTGLLVFTTYKHSQLQLRYLQPKTFRL